MLSRKTIFSTLAAQSPEANNHGDNWEIVLIPNPNRETRISLQLMLDAISSAGGNWKMTEFTGQPEFEQNHFRLLTVQFPPSFNYPLHSRLKHGLKQWAQEHRGKLLDFNFDNGTSCLEFILKIQSRTLHMFQYLGEQTGTIQTNWTITNSSYQEKEKYIRVLTELTTQIMKGEPND